MVWLPTFRWVSTHHTPTFGQRTALKILRESILVAKVIPLTWIAGSLWLTLLRRLHSPSILLWVHLTASNSQAARFKTGLPASQTYTIQTCALAKLTLWLWITFFKIVGLTGSQPTRMALWVWDINPRYGQIQMSPRFFLIPQNLVTLFR
jgi:hypothetical protein